MIRRALRFIGAWLALLWLVVATSCGPKPVKNATALNAAAAAVQLVDSCLAVAITEAPIDAGTEPWEPRVVIVERAAEVIRKAGEVCDVFPAVSVVAQSIPCKGCSALIQTAEEQLQCRQ